LLVILALPAMWRALRPPVRRDAAFGEGMNQLLGRVGRLEVAYAALFALGMLLAWPR